MQNWFADEMASVAQASSRAGHAVSALEGAPIQMAATVRFSEYDLSARQVYNAVSKFMRRKPEAETSCTIEQICLIDQCLSEDVVAQTLNLCERMGLLCSIQCSSGMSVKWTTRGVQLMSCDIDNPNLK